MPVKTIYELFDKTNENDIYVIVNGIQKRQTSYMTNYTNVKFQLCKVEGMAKLSIMPDRENNRNPNIHGAWMYKHVPYIIDNNWRDSYDGTRFISRLGPNLLLCIRGTT